MALRPYIPYHPFFYSNPFALLDHFFDDQSQLQLRDHAGKLSIDPKGNFTYKVDASGFQPEELKVDIEGDEIVVKGNHRVHTEHENVERFFVRRVRIPAHIHKESIGCELDQRGHLTITGKKVATEQPETRSLPINHKPAIGPKSQKNEKEAAGKKQ